MEQKKYDIFPLSEIRSFSKEWVSWWCEVSGKDPSELRTLVIIDGTTQKDDEILNDTQVTFWASDSVAANLINLISQTQESFNKIMDMQLPEIIPFENSELENKFNEISEQLLKATS